MVLNLLTKEDMDKIDIYRKEFAAPYSSAKPCSVEQLLQPWNEAKSNYLESLFGENLIVTRPVEFKEGYDEMADRMSDVVYNDNRIYQFRRAIEEIYRNRCQCYDYWAIESLQARFVQALFQCEWLVNNTIGTEYGYDYFSESNTFELPIGATLFKVQKGMKPIRVITKIANAYGIGTIPDEDGVSDLEHFRRKHSLALNQKALKGNLCLSIHPLDYMTMSDNDEGWDSCMSWSNDGEYKQGTVEMMNSPCVVVGYLASDRNQFNFGWGDTASSWNSKKWRSLFIVDREFIINVKSYPYHNEHLVKAAIAELAEMSGWGKLEAERYMYIEDYKVRSNGPQNVAGRNVALGFGTGAMYNDFGSNHHIVVNPNSTEEINECSYYYSGLSQCVWCGTTNDDEVGLANGEAMLQCIHCNPNSRCEECGERVEPDSLWITADGYKLCEYCWDYHTQRCAITEDDYYDSNVITLYLSKNNEEFIESYQTITVACDNIGTPAWKKFFTIDKYREHEPDNWRFNKQYVFPSDCTAEGLELFEIYNEEDLKDFLGLNDLD